MKTKYITFVGDFGTEGIIIFPEHVGHNDVATGLNVVGAGFCNVDYNDPGSSNCYGNSVSLGVESRGQEDDLLLQMFIRDMVW